MDALTLGEKTMIGALAQVVKDGDEAAGGTLSPLPAAALWLRLPWQQSQFKKYK